MYNYAVDFLLLTHSVHAGLNLWEAHAKSVEAGPRIIG